MGSIISYYDSVTAKPDDRVTGWAFVNSPVPTITLVILYLIIVTVGQSFMKHQKAFDLTRAMVVYNFFLVLLSLYMLFELIVSSWLAPGFNLFCQAVDYSDNPDALRLAGAIWLFFISKLIELMDTVFFVLRKKNGQITFLHVYHHSTMPLLWWFATKYVAGGEAFFCTTLNSGVHAVMYLYYMLSAMGPNMKQYLWWKKFITAVQLIQFWLVIFKAAHSSFLACGFPIGHNITVSIYMLSHIALFSNFCYRTYYRPPQDYLRELHENPQPDNFKEFLGNHQPDNLRELCGNYQPDSFIEFENSRPDHFKELLRYPQVDNLEGLNANSHDESNDLGQARRRIIIT